MSEENIELARRVYAGLSEQGVPPWELFAADFEFDASGVMPDMPPNRGRVAAEPAFRAYTDMFDDFAITLEEVIASDEERVVTAVRDGGRMKGSDAELWNRFFHVFTFRDGKIVRWSSHSARDRAVEAAGLSV